MSEPQPFNPPVLVNPQGRPARPALGEDAPCSKCGAGPDQRHASSGFGIPHPVCVCGHEWHDEVWRPQ